MIANNYNLQNQQQFSGSNSYKIPTPFNNANNYQMPTPNNINPNVNYPMEAPGNNNYSANPYNQMGYQRTPSQQAPTPNTAQNNTNNYGNYPMQQQFQNYYNPNNSANNSKIGTPMNPVGNNANDNYSKMPTPQNYAQMPTPQGQMAQVTNNNSTPGIQIPQRQSNISNAANYYPTPTPQSQINNNNIQLQQQPQQNNFRLPTPQNEYLSKKNSRLPTPQSQINNNNNVNNQYNYRYNYTPIPTPQQNHQGINSNNIYTKRDYVWEVKRQKAQTPSNAGDNPHENLIQKGNQINYNQQRSVKPAQQQAMQSDNNNQTNNENGQKESYRIKKKQEPVIKPYSYHKTENAVNPKLKRNENQSQNNTNTNNSKQPTPISVNQPKGNYPETYWEERERKNFMNQGFNEITNMNYSNRGNQNSTSTPNQQNNYNYGRNDNKMNNGEQRGFTPNSNNNSNVNVYNSKPGSSQSNKPFQNISFKSGTPNNNNYANNQNAMQMNPYMNQQYANNGYPMNIGYNSATPQTQMNQMGGGNAYYQGNGTPLQVPSQQRDNVKFVYNRQQTQN